MSSGPASGLPWATTATTPLHQGHGRNHGLTYNHDHEHGYRETYSHTHSHGSSADQAVNRTPLPSLQFEPPPLSPTDESFDSFAEDDTTSRLMSPNGMLTPSSSSFSISPTSAATSDDTPLRNPFGFQTQTYTAGNAPTKSNMGQRRGHKYKHSSISHQIFLEPAPRARLRIPASLPIPTLRESWSSMTTTQTLRISYCLLHLVMAAYTQYTASGSLALTALSHLLFYDATGALLCAALDVLANFDVWRQASIRQPFGLARAEVLVGFAMSILLLFMGFDLVSHGAAHALDAAAAIGVSEPHHAHTHAGIPSRARLTLSAAIGAGSTAVSAAVLRNHARIGRALRLRFAGLGLPQLPARVAANPSHLLTLACAALLVPLGSVDEARFVAADRLLAAGMALAMCVLGYALVKALGAMLLMSYAGPAERGVTEVVGEVAALSDVEAIEEARVWSVHYGLHMLNVKLSVRGGEQAARRVRVAVLHIAKEKLEIGSGSVNEDVSWEVSVEVKTIE